MESWAPVSTAETEPDPVISVRLAASIPTGDSRALNFSSLLGPAVCAQATSPSETSARIMFRMQPD